MESISGLTMRKLWTIGYGGRKPVEFVALLRDAHVERVADVRLSPRSAMGSYTRAKSCDRGIQKLLSDREITYEWLPELGNPDRTDPTMTEFRKLIVPEFQTRTVGLIDLASSKRTCLLCGCKNVVVCHRAIIAAWLRDQGWEIINL
jgi:uncharacterized protein (DUF488 family)